jgi:isoquinoline 1-oxidoreductase subunit beta
VVANSTWDAIQGRHALKTELDKGPSGDESTESLRELFREHKTTAPGFVPVNQGDAPQALTGAGRKVDAFYELPFQAHATMEPMNTTVHVREDWIEVWSPTEVGAETQAEIAARAPSSIASGCVDFPAIAG